MVDSGYIVFDPDPRVAAWATAAHGAALRVDRSERRHGGTWFVGVDALPNARDGSVDDVPLEGPWEVEASDWHPAQLSIVYPGYPQQDPDESDAAHRYRITRDAAHMDGLLPEGPARRRHLREPHRFILGIPLNAATASPLVVWPGSQVIMRAAFAAVFKGVDPDDWGDVDVTDAYTDARRNVFASCPRVEVPVPLGGAVLLHRHLVHGVAPWSGAAPPEGRMIAYFRPQGPVADWL